MKRNFSKKQRLALAKNADWKCSLCKISLDNSFHADHIIPFSKGGVTDVSNGQALCPKCNMQKGNKMITLRPWQQEALNTIDREFNAGNDKVLVQATPGGGKTIFGLSAFNELKSRNGYTHLIVVVPSVTLAHQWQTDAHNLYNTELNGGMIYKGRKDFNEWDGIITTYQALNESPEEYRQFVSQNNTLVIADEIHHTSDGNTWGDSFRHGVENAKNVLMLTGTPWTPDGHKIPFVEYNEDGYVNTVFSYGKSKAIADKICRIVEFHQHKAENLIYANDETGVITAYADLDAAEEDGKNAYSHAVRNLNTMTAIFEAADMRLSEIRSDNYQTAGGLIVAPDIKTAHKFQEAIFSMTGNTYEIVHSKAENAHKKIKDFRDNTDKWLISVNMVSEGVDIKRLQVCIFLSTAKTELFFRQVVGRIERIRTADRLGEIDKTAYFYCLAHPVLREWITQIEKENQAGIAALEEMNDDDTQERESGTRNFTEDELKELEIERIELIARGIEYPEDIINRAFEIRSRNMRYRELPLYVLCKIAQAEKEDESNKSEHIVKSNTKPLAEQKADIRTVMNKEISRKIAKAGMRNYPNIYQDSNNHINRKCGIRGIEGSSMEQLKDRLDYIYRTEASSWV